MDVRDYEYIVAIADQGNISRAAASLFITQPALTKFLQRTENQVGVPLFVRRGNQFLPTDAGKLYIQAGRDILSIDSQLTDQLSKAMATQKQILRIGYSMGRSDQMLRQVLPIFFEEYPEIRIRAVADSGVKNFAALSKGDLDLVMMVTPEHPAGFQQIPLEKTRFSLVVRKDDPINALARPMEGRWFSVVSLSALKSSRFILSDMTTKSGKLSHRILARSHMLDQIALEVSDVNSCLNAVEAGLGHGLAMSMPIGNRELNFLGIQELEPIEQSACLFYRADWQPPISAQYLIRLIQNCEK